jgi:hypothetical protein
VSSSPQLKVAECILYIVLAEKPYLMKQQNKILAESSLEVGSEL